MPHGRASALDGAQGLDGADKGMALAKDAVGEFSSHYGSVILSVYNSHTSGLVPHKREVRRQSRCHDLL